MFASGISKGRCGRTNTILPNYGKPHRFEELRAGDYFMEGGLLYLKTNLTDAVEVPNGEKPMVGTNQFTAKHIVSVVNVKIIIE